MGLYLAFPVLLFDVFCLGFGGEESDLSGFLRGGAFEQASIVTFCDLLDLV